MKWSFHLARIAGIDVRVHATFFLLLAWLGANYYFDGGLSAAVSGVAFILLLFACVLLHEFGHAIAAKAYGIRTPDITLLPIGGLARLERMPEKPWQEFVVALAGPAVNVVIAFGIWLVLGRFLGTGELERMGQGESDLLSDLLAINVVLVVFNLVPAFPMDGGRVLRSLLAMRLKHSKATRVAALIGQGIAVIFGIIGLLGHPMLLFIAIFVFFGAQQEAVYAAAKEALDETRVAQVMDAAPVVFGTGTRMVEAAQNALLHPAEIYPLVDGHMHPIGTVHASAIAAALRAGAPGVVGSLTSDHPPCLRSDASLGQALEAIRPEPGSTFPVTNASGQIVGLLRRDALADALRGRQHD